MAKTTSCRGLSHVASLPQALPGTTTRVRHTHTHTPRRHTHLRETVTPTRSPGRGVTFANTKLLMPPPPSPSLPLRVAAIKVFICHCQDAGCVCLSLQSLLPQSQPLPRPLLWRCSNENTLTKTLKRCAANWKTADCHQPLLGSLICNSMGRVSSVPSDPPPLRRPQLPLASWQQPLSPGNGVSHSII